MDIYRSLVSRSLSLIFSGKMNTAIHSLPGPLCKKRMIISRVSIASCFLFSVSACGSDISSIAAAKLSMSAQHANMPWLESCVYYNIPTIYTYTLQIYTIQVSINLYNNNIFFLFFCFVIIIIIIQNIQYL